MNGRWKRALIIGASSGIGEAIAKQLAQQGCKVALVARRETELLRIAAPLNATQPQTALTYVNDVRSIESIPELFNRITHELGGLDLVIYASGVMPMLAEGEFSTHKDRQMIDTNFLGAVAWLNEAGDRFVKMKSGTIVGISSVAGDRGRQGFRAQGTGCGGRSWIPQA